MIRSFTMADQRRFAALSGDHNPIHVDPVRARRTGAGEPVVHGIHLLLWALDSLAVVEGDLGPIGTLRVHFSRFVHLGEAVEASVRSRSAEKLQLRLSAGGVPRCDVAIGFGEPGPADVPSFSPGALVEIGTEPRDGPVEAIGGTSGRIAAASSPADIAAAFPAAGRWLGAERLAALAASTRLVGMVHPGLHSIYAGLKVATCPLEPGEAALAFAMGEPRHRLVTAAIAGGGLSGSLDCIARIPPTAQPTMAALKGLIASDAFAGGHALVVGGSRGLGELSAKLLATGGARVTITYRVGADEAEAVAADIKTAGGRCDILRYAVGEPAAPQLAPMGDAPGHAYYFASPTIARPNSTFFDPARLAELEAVFVAGFWDLATGLRARRADARLLYPSTVFIADRPKGMAEYAMAKAAGEILCAEINATMAPLHVTVARLPRMLTDQTAATIAVSTAPAIETLLPVIRTVQGVAA